MVVENVVFFSNEIIIIKLPVRQTKTIHSKSQQVRCSLHFLVTFEKNQFSIILMTARQLTMLSTNRKQDKIWSKKNKNTGLNF